MIFFRKEELRGKDANGNDVYYVEIDVDDAASLPAQNAFIGYIFAMGSKAHCISDNSRYMMNSGGNWILQDMPPSAYTKAETDALFQLASTALLRQGEEIPEYANMDDYVTAGVYFSPNSARTATLYNRPWSGSGFKLLVWSISTTSKQQWYMPMSNSAHSHFTRNRTTTGWRSYYEFEGALIATINPYTPP